jgi:hypothetical protein
LQLPVVLLLAAAAACCRSRQAATRTMLLLLLLLGSMLAGWLQIRLCCQAPQDQPGKLQDLPQDPVQQQQQQLLRLLLACAC